MTEHRRPGSRSSGSTAIGGLLDLRSTTCPQDSAFIDACSGRRLAWHDLTRHARAWRDLADARRLPERTRVAFVVDDPILFTAGYLACLAVGLTAVPVDPRSTETEVAELLARVRARVLLTDHTDPVFDDLDGLEVWEAGDRGPRPMSCRAWTARDGDVAAAQPAVLLTSSGTTGAPKGVPLSEAQLLHAARRVVRHHGLGRADRGYTSLPLFHVNAQVVGLLGTVVSGGSLAVDRGFVRAEYWDRVEQWRPTWLNTVPAILTALVEQPAPPAGAVHGIRFARSASAPLSPRTLSAFERHAGIGVLETYGMTEAAGQITANPLDAAARVPGSVGVPVGVGLAVLRPDGGIASPGEQGMVALRGRTVVTHYLEPAGDGGERSRPARDENGWLRTGDIGHRDDGGFVHLAGRADDVINRGGEKFHPREVETILLEHPGVAAAVVVGAPHPRLGQVAVAVVVPRAGASGSLIGDLMLICERRLTRYKRPVDVQLRAVLPLGSTGKVLRRSISVELEREARVA